MDRDFGFVTESQTISSLHAAEPPYPPMPVTMVTTGAEVTYERGTVLGKVTASGKFRILAPAASDGTENAAAVLAEEITVGASADENTSAYKAGYFKYGDLVWPDGITTAQKKAAYLDLEAAGIYVNLNPTAFV